MTCLNLFATKIDQVVGLLEKRAADVERVLIDTPGQIECFVWYVVYIHNSSMILSCHLCYTTANI